MSGSDKVLLMVFIRTSNIIASRSAFDKELSHKSWINHMKEKIK